jgi:hypothetical protein
MISKKDPEYGSSDLTLWALIACFILLALVWIVPMLWIFFI